MKRIWADTENNAERFWEAVDEAAAAGDKRAALAKQIQLCGQATLELPDDEAARLLNYAATLPGWSDGPAHAAEPLIVQDVECETCRCIGHAIPDTGICAVCHRPKR